MPGRLASGQIGDVIRAVPSKTILASLLALLALTGAGLLAYSLWTDRAERLQQAGADTESAAQFLNGYTNRLLGVADAMVRRTIAQVNTVPEAGWRDRELWEAVAGLAAAMPAGDLLWVIDADGQVVLSTFQYPRPAIAVADREYFLAHARDGIDLFVGPVISSRLDGQRYFTISRPIRSGDGRFRGVAVAAIEVAGFIDFQRQIGLAAGSTFTLLRLDGQVLVRQPAAAEEGLRLPALADLAAQAPQGTAVLPSLVDASAQITSYRGDPVFPVMVAVSTGMHEVLAPWRQLLWRSVAGSVAVMLFLLAAASLAWRSARQEQAAIAALQVSHDQLEQKVGERTAALEAQRRRAQETVEQLRFALTAAQASIWEYDPQSGAMNWSETAYRLYGREGAEMPASHREWAALLHPDDRRLTEELGQVTFARRLPTYRSEFRISRPDGSVRWLAAIAKVFYGAHGTPLRLTGLHIDITSLKQAEDAMREAKLEAERANVAKSKFLAAASHDLRQPFQAMRLFYEVLSGLITEPRAQQVAQRLNEAMRGGEELLSALLDVSTLDAGTVRLAIEALPVAEVLAQVVAECEPQAQEKGLRLRAVPSAALVVSDRVLLARMLRNLVINAIRYTPSGGILVGCRHWGNALRIEVWDTGIGIPADKQSLIFEDFYQIDNDSRDRSRGLGLGLSVVLRMGRLLGHPVELRSRPGKGSVFSLVLPRAGAALAQPAAASLLEA